MKALVAIKRVVDYKTTVRIKQDGTAVDIAHAKMGMNPFDEIALEEALCLKEKGIFSDVLVVSIGNKTSTETLLSGLAMGADRGMLIETDQDIEPLAAAKIFKKIISDEDIGFFILGKLAIDSDNNQVGQMTAGLLNWPQATFASKIEFHDGGVSVMREIDGGLQTLFLTLPAVVTTDLRLNQPRYTTLPNIIKAKQKQLKIVALSELGLADLTPRVKLLSVAQPEKKRVCKKLTSVAELVDKLRHEAQVIA